MKTKGKKTKTSSSAKPIESTDFYRKKLEGMRDDLVNLLNKKKDETHLDEPGGDEGDIAIRSLERDLVFEQSGNERHLLDEVEAALRRIEKGIFGVCEANGEKILIARLKAIPYARYCIKCQARFDHT
jgi:DnaK suppressor protein